MYILVESIGVKWILPILVEMNDLAGTEDINYLSRLQVCLDSINEWGVPVQQNALSLLVDREKEFNREYIMRLKDLYDGFDKDLEYTVPLYGHFALLVLKRAIQRPEVKAGTIMNNTSNFKLFIESVLNDTIDDCITVYTMTNICINQCHEEPADAADAADAAEAAEAPEAPKAEAAASGVFVSEVATV